jgi:U1 small nuclear ribonucleoprotein C
MYKDKTNTHAKTGDYCDVYLTHDSMSVRKAHNTGRNHLRNVVDYYQRMPSLYKRVLAESH